MSKNITIDETLEKYISDNSYNLHPIQKEIIENNKKLGNLKIMQISVTQGYFLQLIIKLNNVKSVLEIGTFTGYSALCLAEGLSLDGELHTIDNNEELVDFQRRYFNKSAYGPQILQHLGPAADIIPTLDTKFDLIFIDADKPNYIVYFNQIIDKLSPGGVILSDNVLWSGKVVEELDSKDLSTKIVLEYNTLLKEDPRLETVLLPIRDGLTVSIRK